MQTANQANLSLPERDLNAAGFMRDGRLEYVGEHYLKQADGAYWIKGGIDSPGKLLWYAGFDNTIDQPGGVTGGPKMKKRCAPLSLACWGLAGR